MCISFGNPSEPCCKRFPDNWVLIIAFPYAYRDDEAIFQLYPTGNTSHRATKARDWTFEIEKIPPVNGRRRLRLIARIPSLPANTLYGRGEVSPRFWNDVPRMDPIVLFEDEYIPGNTPYIQYTYLDAVVPDQGIEFASVGSLYSANLAGDIRRNFDVYRNRRFRVDFRGATVPLSAIPNGRIEVSAVTRSESISRRLSGTHQAILCSASFVGDSFEGSQLSGLENSGAHVVIPFSVYYDKINRNWVQGGRAPGSLVSDSWFIQDSVTHISDTRFQIRWRIGFERFATADVFVSQL